MSASKYWGWQQGQVPWNLRQRSWGGGVGNCRLPWLPGGRRPRKPVTWHNRLVCVSMPSRLAWGAGSGSWAPAAMTSWEKRKPRFPPRLAGAQGTPTPPPPGFIWVSLHVPGSGERQAKWLSLKEQHPATHPSLPHSLSAVLVLQLVPGALGRFSVGSSRAANQMQGGGDGLRWCSSYHRAMDLSSEPNLECRKGEQGSNHLVCTCSVPSPTVGFWVCSYLCIWIEYLLFSRHY